MASNSDSNSDPSLKLALAIALIRSKLCSSSSSSSESDAAHWKQKAKKRKQDLLMLKQQLKEFQDGSQCDPFPVVTASCKCHFYDYCGKSSSSGGGDGSDGMINELLHRRFLRQVRWRERQKKAGDSVLRQRHSFELNGDDEIEQLSTSADFLLELCSSGSPAENYSSFAMLSHQAVDFISASLKSLVSRRKDSDLVEEIIVGLIRQLIRRMCTPSERYGSTTSASDTQSCIQHLIRKLGSEPYIGQRTMLLVSQQLYGVADSLLFMDPFDNAFPDLHGCIFMMMQLMEFLISDYIQTWTNHEEFDNRMFGEWMRSIAQVKKALNLLESRNGLYILYMDRLIGELVKQVGSTSRSEVLNIDILSDLLH